MSIYETSVDYMLDDDQIREEEKERCFRLATVSSLFEDGYYKITFYGESTESEKKYKRLEMAMPNLNDTVLTAFLNDNYIILGKITGTVPIAGDGFLTQKQAEQLFAAKEHTHNEYAAATHSHSSLKPSASSNLSLYLDTGALKPSSSGAFDLGSPSYKFGNAYLADVYSNGYHLNHDKIYVAGSENSYYVKMYGNNIFGPSGNGSMNLGSTNNKYNTLYALNSTIATSDKKEKHDIEELDERYIKFLSLLKPRRYKYNKGESNRYHTGFIAQDIERALKKCGISSEEFAGFVKFKQGEGYGYGLRYEEFIALLVDDRNRNLKRIENLEKDNMKLKENNISNNKEIKKLSKIISNLSSRLDNYERGKCGE